MSLKTLLATIWASIQSLWAGMEPELKIAVGIGVNLVENIKTFVFSPGADVLAAIIPGNLGTDVENWLRAKLPNILVQMKLVDVTLGLTDPNEITAAAIKTLQALDPSVSAAFLHGLSVLVAQVAADGKLTWEDGVYILEYYYKNEFPTAGAVS